MSADFLFWSAVLCIGWACIISYQLGRYHGLEIGLGHVREQSSDDRSDGDSALRTLPRDFKVFHGGDDR